MQLSAFLQESPYIDYSDPLVATKSAELLDGLSTDTEKARVAYEFVRDNIPHTFDVQARVVTAKASDVLRHETGICHAKSNLLAALLRAQGIPTGFCFQRLTLAEDDALGHCIHCFSAIYLEGRWVRVDARGNTGGIAAAFSLDEPQLAFASRPEYGEYIFEGIYAQPHAETMDMLTRARSVSDILFPESETITATPDVRD